MKHICPKCGKWVPKEYKKSHPNGCSHATRKLYRIIKKVVEESIEKYFGWGGRNENKEA